MPRGVAKAAQTVEAVNGPDNDRLTPGFDDDDDALTVEHEGRYKIVTPRAVKFQAYGVNFVEGIGRTDDAEVAQRLKQEFGYKIVDTQKGERAPLPQALPEGT
jgi:hypothetical protein